jgi:hypothetical protein
MLNPKATLKLMNEGFWGAKAMERRVKKCCAANPGCPYQERCLSLYDYFVDNRDAPDPKSWPSYRRAVETRMKNYYRLRQAGIPSREATRRATNRQTTLVLQEIQ